MLWWTDMGNGLIFHAEGVNGRKEELCVLEVVTIKFLTIKASNTTTFKKNSMKDYSSSTIATSLPTKFFTFFFLTLL